MTALPCLPKITLTFGQVLCRPVVQELSLLSERIKQVDGVRSVMTRLDLHGSQQIVIYTLAGVEHAALLRRMAMAMRVPLQAARIADHAVATAPPDPLVGTVGPTFTASRTRLVTIEADPGQGPQEIDTPGMAQRLRQFAYGVLAAGSVGMAWVGLLVPGIPTVPFVILAAVFAAKSSPALHQRLRQGRVFGPMIRDWEEHHGIRPRFRRQAILLTVVIVGITTALAPPSPALYVLIGSMTVFSLSVICWIPVIPAEPRDSDVQRGPKLLSAVA